MRVVVIGAGVVGVTSAWYLTKLGHEVTVLEAREGPGLETSFGNAGGVCPGFAGPWAAPGMPFKAARWMFESTAPLKIRPQLSIAQWRWLSAFVWNCRSSRFAKNKTRMQRIAHYSKECLVALRDETGIAYDHGTGGVLQIFQTQEEADGGARSSDVLAELGIEHRLMNSAEAIKIEPGLANASVPLSGALHLPNDETGDCHLFCQELAKLCAEKGANFQYNAKVSRLKVANDRIAAAETDRGAYQADAFVMATGPWTDLLSKIGINVPVYPVKGYSLTVEIADLDAAPCSSIMDEHTKVMVTRLGNRLRAGGVAELSGFDSRMPQAVLSSLRSSVEALFPDAADYENASYWHGFRPMTPGGPNRVGKTRYNNFFLNLGHGSNGWTQACGTGKIMADIVSGNPVDPELCPS